MAGPEDPRDRHPRRVQHDLWLGPSPRTAARDARVDPDHAEVARANIDRAGLGRGSRCGSARARLRCRCLADEGPFDLVFIDADKSSNADYFEWAVDLTRPEASSWSTMSCAAAPSPTRESDAGAGQATPPRAHRRRAPRDRDHDPDGRSQRLRRLHPRLRPSTACVPRLRGPASGSASTTCWKVGRFWNGNGAEFDAAGFRRPVLRRSRTAAGWRRRRRCRRRRAAPGVTFERCRRGVFSQHRLALRLRAVAAVAAAPGRPSFGPKRSRRSWRT